MAGADSGVGCALPWRSLAPCTGRDPAQENRARPIEDRRPPGLARRARAIRDRQPAALNNTSGRRGVLKLKSPSPEWLLIEQVKRQQDRPAACIPSRCKPRTPILKCHFSQKPSISLCSLQFFFNHLHNGFVLVNGCCVEVFVRPPSSSMHRRSTCMRWGQIKIKPVSSVAVLLLPKLVRAR